MFLCRIAQFSDLHLVTPEQASELRDREPSWHNHELLDHATDLAETAVKALNAAAPDLVVVTGDLTHRGTEDSFRLAHDVLIRLKMPFLVLTGNHDVMEAAARSAFRRTFADCFPGENLYGAWHGKGIRCLTLDAWWIDRAGVQHENKRPEDQHSFSANPERGGYGMSLPSTEMEWLRLELRNYPDTPTLIFVHMPLVPIPANFRTCGRKDAGCLQDGEVILDELKKHRQVRAVFCGHQHYNHIIRVSQVEANRELLHCTLCATVEYPMMWREVTLNDVLTVTTHELPVESLRQRSLVDKTTTGWVRGEDKDLKAQINL